MHRAAATRTDYSIDEVAGLLRLPRAEVRRCLKAGVLSTPWQAGQEARLNFQDLVLLRSVASLASARIPPHRVRRAFQRLKAQLADSQSLSGLQVTAGGNQLVVRQGEHTWDAESSQLLLDFERRSEIPSKATSRLPLSPVPLPSSEAEVWYQRGCRLEDSEPLRSVHAYREAIARDPSHVESRINLGRLLHASGDRSGAEVQFREAAALRREDPTVSFNLAVTLEDRGADAEAMAIYAQVLFLDPHFADAHFNLARLHERRGDRLAALRHLSAYRNLHPD
jgi:tetratricopeptide (TPR) repeat protein